MTVSDQPTIYIIAGCNGAGKTTASFTFLPTIVNCRLFVNADEIARGISPLNPEDAAVAAGRLMLQRIRELVSRKDTFAFETTLSSLVYGNMIPEWQKLGYRVQLIFLYLKSGQMAVQRVRARVAAGGHAVDEDVIHRRYTRGLSNFDKVYKSMVDRWCVYDNSYSQANLVAQGTRYVEVVNDSDVMSQFKEPEEHYESQWAYDILRGINEGIRKMIEEARLHDRKVVIYKGGKVQEVPAREITFDDQDSLHDHKQ